MSTHEPEDWGHEDCSVCEEARKRAADEALLKRGRAVFLRYDALSYVSWYPGADAAEIRGFYTPDDLEALAVWMRAQE